MAFPKIKYNSPIILTFSTICLLSFFFFQGTAQYQQYFMVDRSFTHITDYLSLITYIFGHADEAHLFGNLTYILLLGPIVEEKYGGGNLSWMIIITAVITGLINIFFFPNVALLGASGIVFMLIILVSFTNVHRGQVPLTFILVVILFIGKELVQSLSADNISQLAHILGGICGGFFGFTIGKPRIGNTFTDVF
jgi:rhomboid protease GluP